MDVKGVPLIEKATQQKAVDAKVSQEVYESFLVKITNRFKKNFK